MGAQRRHALDRAVDHVARLQEQFRRVGFAHRGGIVPEAGRRGRLLDRGRGDVAHPYRCGRSSAVTVTMQHHPCGREVMKTIVKSVRGFALAALVASTPAAAQVILNASSWVPPGHPLTATMLAPLCADIERATAARVKCNILPKAPVGAVQTFDGVKDGLMDLSFITHGYTPGRFALTDAPEFPFMGDTAEVTAVAYQRIYERMLAGANEHRDVVLLSVFTHGPGQMYNTKRAINALKDLEGLKIRVGGGL